ncbi:MAG TPA: MFS transporter [Thermoanaerobaculia bacterium]|nr:MFS transporter [Thermoanaerobaculia bacterium]
MRFRTLPVFLGFFVMGFVDAVGTLVGFAEKQFHLSGAQAGLLPFFGFIAFALFSVPAGVVADRKGKKFLLVASLAVVLAGQLIPSLSVARYELLLGAIFLIGVGMAALQVAGNPIMRDVSAPGRYAQNLTFAQFIKSLGSISGPYLTAELIALGFAWYHVFPVFAAVTLLTLLLVAALPITETRGDEVPASVGSSFALLAEPPVALAVLGIFLYVGAEVGLNSWLATLLARDFGMDLGSTATRLGPGLFFISLAAGRLLGSGVLSFMGARRFFLVSALVGLAGLGLLFLGSRPAALAGIACCGLGFANIWPLVFSLTVESRPERSGALSGLLCMAIFGGAVMPALMGLVADHAGVRLAFLVPLAAFAYLTLLALGSRSAAGAAPPPAAPATASTGGHA